MGDTSMRFGFGAVGLGRAQATGITVVKGAQQQALKIDFVDASRLVPHRHRVTRERLADEAPPALPLDLTVVADVPHHPAVRVAEALRATIRVTAAPIEGGGLASAQGFMGTLGVVIPPPAVTAQLLAGRVRRRWPRGVAFEFPGHLFMRAIFLRVAGPAELDPDAQGQPPDTQDRAAPGTRAAKGRTIVHADHLGQSVAAEQADKNAAPGGLALVRQHPHRQQVAAEEVADGEGIAPGALGGAA